MHFQSEVNLKRALDLVVILVIIQILSLLSALMRFG